MSPAKPSRPKPEPRIQVVDRPSLAELKDLEELDGVPIRKLDITGPVLDFLKTGNIDSQDEHQGRETHQRSAHSFKLSHRAAFMYMNHKAALNRKVPRCSTCYRELQDEEASKKKCTGCISRQEDPSGIPLPPEDDSFHPALPTFLVAPRGEMIPELNPKVQPRDVGHIIQRFANIVFSRTPDGKGKQTPIATRFELRSAVLYDQLDPKRDEIRLLWLFPGGWSDPIACDLYKAYVDDRPKYEALSYCWGDASVTRAIRVNGEHEMQVTASLESALRRLRHPIQPRLLWVDAICINQQDIVEKSKQVSMMDKIYSESHEVLAWLGEEELTQNSTDNSRAATRVLEWLASDIHFKQLPFYQGFDPSIPNPFDATGPHLLRALIRFVSRAWWDRSWIIQEVALPPRVTLFVGHVMIDWDLVSNAAAAIEKHRRSCCGSELDHLVWADHMPYLTKFSTSVMAMQKCRFTIQGMKLARRLLKDAPDLAERPGDPLHSSRKEVARIEGDSLGNLMSFVAIARSRNATNPRDKINAVLGMANACAAEHCFESEYSAPVQDLYHRFATTFLMNHPTGLGLLLEKEDADRTAVKGLPSWAPDWGVPLDFADYHAFRTEASSLFSAPGGQPIERKVVDRTLSVRAMKVDQVSLVGDVMDNPTSMQEIRTHKLWIKLIKDYYFNSPSTFEAPYGSESMAWCTAIWQVLFGGVQLHDSAPPTESDDDLMKRGYVGKALGELSLRRAGFQDLWAFVAWAEDLTGFMPPEDAYMKLDDIGQAFALNFSEALQDVDPETLEQLESYVNQNSLGGEEIPIEISEDPEASPDQSSQDEKEALEDISGDTESAPNQISHDHENFSERAPSPTQSHQPLPIPLEIPSDFAPGTSLTTTYQTIRCATMGRRIFVTSKGYIGIGPKGLKVGDSVFVVAGISVPIALRGRTDRKEGSLGDGEQVEEVQEDEGEGSVGIEEEGGSTVDGEVPEIARNREFVGACYMHGIMDGEVVKDGWDQAQIVGIE